MPSPMNLIRRNRFPVNHIRGTLETIRLEMVKIPSKTNGRCGIISFFQMQTKTTLIISRIRPQPVLFSSRKPITIVINLIYTVYRS